MFIAILVMCTISINNNNRIECKSVMPGAPFYTKRECELATKAKYEDDFICMKMPELKTKS